VISTIVIRENQVQAACARKIALESPLINISRDPIIETNVFSWKWKKMQPIQVGI
jgi:hypothetical protein